MSRSKILVSACLLGVPVRYDGGAFDKHAVLARWQAQGRIISLCPEVAGGLPTPRLPAEIQGKTKVINTVNQNVTAFFLKGAQHALELAKTHDVKMAVLKAKSPSCGNSEIYDGSFSGRLIEGQGVTAKALSDAGVKIFNETELFEAEAYLQTLDA